MDSRGSLLAHWVEVLQLSGSDKARVRAGQGPQGPEKEVVTKITPVKRAEGIPWQSSGSNSMLLLQEIQVRPLVGEQRSCEQ